MIAVLAILAVLGIPSFQNLIRDNRVTAQSNELSALISYARSTASKGASTIVLTITTNGAAWQAVVEEKHCDSAGTCVVVQELRDIDFQNVAMDSSGSSFPLEIRFNNRGILTDGQIDLSLQHVPCAGQRQRRELDVLISGAVRSRNEACSTEE